MSEQLPPYELEAEEATIGALLIDPDAMSRVMATGLRHDDFYIARLGLIFRAIAALHDQDLPSDYVLVVSELGRAGHLETVGGPAEVTALITRCPTSIYATHYANVVRKCALRRRTIAAAATIAEVAYASEGTAEELAERINKVLQDLGSERSAGDNNIQGIIR